MMNEGAYAGLARKATLCETKNGREQVAIELVSEDGEAITAFRFFGDKTGKDGKTITERTVIDLRVCGWTGDDLSDLSSVNNTAAVEFVVQHEEYQGKVSAKVAFINSPGGGAFKAKPMDEKKAKRFAEKMKINVGRVSSPTPVRTESAPSSQDEDDLPF